MSDPAWPAAPAGFRARPMGSRALYADASLQEAVLARGLDVPEGWEAALRGGDHASGRAATVVIHGADAARWRLKSMRRGGLTAALWRDRYPAAGRLVATLSAGAEARSRGVPVPRTVAMLLMRGPWLLTRGFMAFEEIEGAEDLERRTRRGAVTREDLAATMAAVRAMHDVGVIHPDLNLGNILLREAAGTKAEIHFVDFDRARCLDGPVPFAARQAAIRRLERSCAKLTGDPGALGDGSEELWYTLYANDDEALAARLARGRLAGRARLALHRLGWRRAP